MEMSEVNTLKETLQIFVLKSNMLTNAHDCIPVELATSFIEDSVIFFTVRTNLEIQMEYHFIICDKESQQSFSSETFVLKGTNI